MKRKIILLFNLLIISACGQDGKDGNQGAKGDSVEGQTINIIKFSSDTSVCPSGSGIIIQVLNPSWMLSGTSVASEAVICDGLNGKDGAIGETGEQGLQGAEAASSPYQVVQVIDPCGDAPGVWDEVFLKMANGQLIASFSDNANGKNTRLSLLTEGHYMTTDGSNCQVNVDSGGLVTW